MKERPIDGAKNGLVSRLTKLFSTKSIEDVSPKAHSRALNGQRLSSLQTNSQAEFLHPEPAPIQQEQVVDDGRSQHEEPAQPAVREQQQDLTFSPLGCSMCIESSITEKELEILESFKELPDFYSAVEVEPKEPAQDTPPVVEHAVVDIGSSDDTAVVTPEPHAEPVVFEESSSNEQGKMDMPALSDAMECTSEMMAPAAPGETDADPPLPSLEVEVNGKAVEESVANDAESGRTPDYVSQQTFNFTFLDPPATERSQSQPAVDPPKFDSNDLLQEAYQEQQGRPGKKDDTEDQSLSPSCQQSSSEGSSISQLSQNRSVSVPAGVPVLQLSKMASTRDDSHNASEDEDYPDAAEEPVQNPAGGASVVSHSLSESSWESDGPDARVEVSVCTSQQVDQDDVATLVHKAEARTVQFGERSPKRSPLSSQEFRTSIGKKSRLRHRSKSRSPLASQSNIPAKAAKGSVIRLHKQSPSRVPIGRQRFDKSHKTKFKLSPPFLLRKIRNRVALTIQKPQDAAPSLEANANVRNTMASRLKDCQDLAQGADSPESDQATGPELRVQQPAATATKGPQSSERTGSPTDPPRKLRIDIPGMPSPSSASRSSQDHCQPLDIIAPRSQPPPEPSYKIPALKLPMTASQTWQDALTQGWHPRQMRRELLQKEKERALLLSAKEQPDANVMPQLLKPPLPAPAAELCSQAPVSNAHQGRPPVVATRHTWAALTPDCATHSPQDFVPRQSRHAESNCVEAGQQMEDLSHAKPKEQRRVRFAEDHQNEIPSAQHDARLIPSQAAAAAAAFSLDRPDSQARQRTWSGPPGLGGISSHGRMDSGLWTSHGGMVSSSVAVDGLEASLGGGSKVITQSRALRTLAVGIDVEQGLRSQDTDIAQEMSNTWSNTVSQHMDLAQALRTETRSISGTVSLKPPPQELFSRSNGYFPDLAAVREQFGLEAALNRHTQMNGHAVASQIQQGAPALDDVIIRPSQPLSESMHHTNAASHASLQERQQGEPSRARPSRQETDTRQARFLPPRASHSASNELTSSAPPSRKLPTLSKPESSAARRKTSAPIWTTHTSTKALLQQLSTKQSEKVQIQRLRPNIQPGIVAARQAEIVARLEGNRGLTSSKTGPLWTAPPSLREWDQSTVMSCTGGDADSQSISPTSPSSVHGHPLSSCTSPRSYRSSSWAPDMEAVQEVCEDGFEDEGAIENTSVLSFRPVLPTQGPQPPARLTQATLQNRAVLDTVACDVDFNAFQPSWLGPTPSRQFMEYANLISPDVPRAMYQTRYVDQASDFVGGHGIRHFGQHALGAV